MKLFYEGVDIFNEVSLNTCIYDSYGEEQPDTLRVIFNDGNDVWDKWSPQKGDRIQAVLGACDTGIMYVQSVKPENGLMCLRATSVPSGHNDKSNKSWMKVHFKQLCQENAERHDWTVESYGVEDFIYEYVNQQNKEDFMFLEERCVLEGCAFLVYDGKLIVYNESFIESQSTKYRLSIPNNVPFEYEDRSNEVYGVCVLKNGSITGSYTTNINTKTLTKVMNIRISSQAEADRYAKNLLRYANKKMASGVCKSGTFMPGYAAGSIVELHTEGVASWNGIVFINHVRQDLVKAQTKIFLRKPLEGY